jgi:RNA polymerase sigma-70 factor, ECF subfamily
MIGAEFETTLAAAQTGAEWAVTVLYRDLNPALLRFLRAQAADAGDDLAQEVWISAAPRLAGFSGDERAFSAWMFTIARRRLIDHWRQVGRRPSVAVQPDDLTALAPPTAGSPDDHLLAQAAVAEIVVGLPAEQAEILLLRIVAGLDIDEVAAIVGKRPGTVRVIQHRALRRVARRLSQESVTT